MQPQSFMILNALQVIDFTRWIVKDPGSIQYRSMISIEFALFGLMLDQKKLKLLIITRVEMVLQCLN